MTAFRWFLLSLGLLSYSPSVIAEDGCVSGIRLQSTGECLQYPTVEFLLLREGICRVGWVEDTGSELRIKDLHTIPCPPEELKSYLP